MRVAQRTIVGGGLALGAVVAAALFVGTVGITGPQTAQSSDRTSDTRLPTAPIHTPEPVNAAEDRSVGTLPSPADPAQVARLDSPEAVSPAGSAPAESAPGVRARGKDGKALGAQKSQAARRGTGDRPNPQGWGYGVSNDGWKGSAHERHDRDRDGRRDQHHGEHPDRRDPDDHRHDGPRNDPRDDPRGDQDRHDHRPDRHHDDGWRD